MFEVAMLCGGGDGGMLSWRFVGFYVLVHRLRFESFSLPAGPFMFVTKPAEEPSMCFLGI